MACGLPLGMRDYYFPHTTMRPGQEGFCDSVYDAILARSSLFVHAPTGSGKTASVLAPAVSYAMRNSLKVIFLTSRHTQHEIALSTIRLLNAHPGIEKEYGRVIRAADLIGKRSMCALELPALYGSDFTAFCKSLRDHEKCEYYLNTRRDGKLTQQAKAVVSELEPVAADAQMIKDIGAQRGVCPYEIAMRRVEDADVIVADYNHVFNPRIREAFLAKARTKLEETIVIADEAHNLPSRIRNVLNLRCSRFIVERAVSEATDAGDRCPGELVEDLRKLSGMLSRFATSFSSEDVVERDALLKVVSKSLGDGDLDRFVEELEELADHTRSQERASFCSTLASFLLEWAEEREGVLRMVSRSGEDFSFFLRALDPAIIADPVVNRAYSFIAVSGTLVPVEMFAELIGADDARTLVVENPFPRENRMDLILTNATTKYDQRGPETYAEYARSVMAVCEAIPGNIAVFFPSYSFLESVLSRMETTHGKRLVCERRGMMPAEKQRALEEFRSAQRESGAVLFGVVSGSFGEGVDLPGDALRAVVVIGLPFEAPDLETRQLIEYYDRKFGKGWDFGYLYPAFNRIFQNAGRLIRTPTDRGAVIYIDSRYGWGRYRRILDGLAPTQVFHSRAGNFDFRRALSEFYGASGSLPASHDTGKFIQ